MDDSSRSDEVLDICDHGVAIHDSNHQLVTWNDTFERVGLVPENELREGLPLSDLYRLVAEQGFFGSGSSSELARERYERLRRRDAPGSEILRSADGREILIRRYFLESGHIAALFSSRDTLRTNTTFEPEAERFSVVGRAASGLVHNLNNLLTVVQGSLESIRDDRQALPDSDSLRVAQEAVETSAQLTESVIGLIRSSADPVSTVDAADAVESCTRFLERILPQNIALKVDPGDAVYVRVDRSRLVSAILNLSLNARDSMPHGGRLSLRVQSDLAHCEIVVRDSGHGMNPESLARAHEHLDRGRSEAPVASGLGLAEVKRFASDSNGVLKLEKVRGFGTTASLVLPRVESETESHPDVREASTLSGRLLLVEADRMVRSATTRMLERLGLEVTPTENATEAIVALSTGEFDLALSDIDLSGEWSGLDFYSFMQRREPDFPIVLYSGWPDSAEQEIPIGASVLSKPFDVEDVRNVLGEVLESRRRVRG